MKARLASTFLLLVLAAAIVHGAELGAEQTWKKIAPFFRPPAELADDFGDYKSPLIFDDGRPVRNAQDWQQRREEILRFWHQALGPWPPLIERPSIEVLETRPRDNFARKKVRLQIAAELNVEAYLLVPEGRRPFPAVLVVYYDAETGAGLKPEKKFRDFGYQLARRGFVALSIGWPRDYTNQQSPRRQPLSSLAYVAANCYKTLATLPEVDPKRVGVVGHSFGGKWAMFAACLYEKFACTAWSDPGVVFDEKRPNVNYWEPENGDWLRRRPVWQW